MSKPQLMAVVGLVLNGAGLSLFGDAVIHKAVQPDYIFGWFWEGTLALIFINAGICLVVESTRSK